MTGNLAGRVALVTGGGRGIGRAVALGLATAGARTVMMARSRDQLDATTSAIRAAGGQAASVAIDLGDPASLEDAGAQAAAVFGPVDILVNNAAMVAPLGPTTALNLAAWTAAFDLNVTAPAALTLAVLPAMLDRSWGRVVNVSSGIVAHPGYMIGGNAYATTKAALEAHTLNLAAELAGTGVTVNVYRPGSVDTAMQEWIRSQNPNEIGAQLHGRFVRSHAEGGLLTPEQSARVLLERVSGNDTGQIWDAASTT